MKNIYNLEQISIIISSLTKENPTFESNASETIRPVDDMNFKFEHSFLL